MTTTSFVSSVSRQNLVNRQDVLSSMMYSHSAERILDGNRFGNSPFANEMALLRRIFSEESETGALYPTFAVLQDNGYDVNTMASVIELGLMSAEALGDLIAGTTVAEVNNEVLTTMLCHFDGCEIDLGALREAGYDYESIASALYSGAVSKPQLLCLVHSQTVEDVNTAVACLLERSNYRWN